MALGGISAGWMFFAGQVTDRHELSAEVLGAACELAGASVPAATSQPSAARPARRG
jgi:hypothetical protein